MLFHFSFRHADFFMDGHPQATVVLIPCSLLQCFQETAMEITLFSSFHLFLTLQCIPRGGVLHIPVSARNFSYGQSQRCLVWPETEMSRMAGNRNVLYGQRQRCLVWLGKQMSYMARDGDGSYGRR